MTELNVQISLPPPDATDGIAVAEPVRPRSPGPFARGGIVIGSGLLFAMGAMAALGAAPGSSADPAAAGVLSAATTDSVVGRTAEDARFGGVGFERGGHGFGRGGITITTIDGSSLSLETDDGWTRTITTTSDTTVTRAGATITIGDLVVGDQIGFRQKLGEDGTYTITAINVVLPRVVGQVTAIDGSTITLKQVDGTTATVRVSSSTTYAIGEDADATLSDLTVDMFIVAAGTQAADGSIDAAAVRGGTGAPFGRGGHGGHGGPGGPRGDDAPDASAAPTASTTPG
jgi:hypothetical protein